MSSPASPIAEWTLAETAAAIAARRISSRDAVSACLERIERWQPHINSFVEVFAEQALVAADAADQRVSSGAGLGALHGVPLAHKDMYLRSGRRSSFGSHADMTSPATTTATLLSRLDAAGALEIGTLNMSEFALGPTGHNERFGPCRNPWQTAHVACGSSSGGGATVAARLAYGSLGSDTGGSVRLPASVTGVLGLKPTYGLLSGHGMMPLSGSADTPGIFARTAVDLALLLAAVAGHDSNDQRTAERAVPEYGLALDMPELPRGLRIGVPRGFFLEQVSADVQRALDASLRALVALGAELVEVTVPESVVAHYTELSRVLVYAEATALHGPRLQRRWREYSPQVRVRAASGLAIPAPVHQQALQLRPTLLREFVATVFAHCDVLHLPTLAIPAPTIAETDVGAATVMWEKIAMMVRCTAPFNYLGLPGLAVPCGFTDNGVPTSFQLVGRPFSEARLLRIAHAYEQVSNWTRRVPSLPSTLSDG